MTKRDSTPPQRSRRARWWRTAQLGVALLVVGYFVAVVAVSFEASRLYFGYRLLETNLTDFSWQLELPWRASRGQWSGRDFQFPMGPAWQFLGYVAWVAFGGASGVVAGLELIAALLASATVFMLFREGRGPLLLKVLLASVALVWTSASGTASIRGLLSLGLIVAYAGIRVDKRALHTAKNSMPAAALLILGGLMSFDRLVLGAAAIGCMSAWELGVLRLRHASTSRAISRSKGFAIATAAVAAIVAVLALVCGANPVSWLTSQLAFTRTYAVNLGYSSRGGLPGICAVISVAVCVIVAHDARAGRGKKLSVSGLGLVGGLVVAGFALVQPDPGHLALAFLPLVILMLRLAARTDARGFSRMYAGFVAVTFVVGWFMARPLTWFSPRVFGDYAWARAGHGADPRFETDLARVVGFAREVRTAEDCVGFPATMTAAHALADVVGPTSLALRWNSFLQEQLARDIREARCGRVVRQLASVDHSNVSWYLGADFLAVAELYAFERHLGPATVAMKLRASPALPTSTPIPFATQDQELAVSASTSVRLPLEVPVRSGDIVRMEYTLRASPLRARLGYAPGLMFHFGGPGGLLHDDVYVYDMSVNRRAVTYLAFDPEDTERFWMVGQSPSRSRRATSLTLATTRRGLLSDGNARLVVHQLTRLRPAPALVKRLEVNNDPCGADSPTSVARGTALRKVEGGLRFRPGKPREALAAVFFEAAECENRCFFAEVAARGRSLASPPLRVEAHRVTGMDRPRMFDQKLSVSGPGASVRIPLTGTHQWVRIGPAPLETRHTDIEIQKPRFAACLRRGSMQLGTAARVHSGAITPQASQWVVEDRAQVHVRVAPLEDSCLQATFMLESEDGVFPKFDVRVGIVADGVQQRLLRTTLTEVVSFLPLGPISLRDFRDRIVEVRFSFAKREGKGTLVVVDPVLVRCDQ